MNDFAAMVVAGEFKCLSSSVELRWRRGVNANLKIRGLRFVEIV